MAVTTAPIAPAPPEEAVPPAEHADVVDNPAVPDPPSVPLTFSNLPTWITYFGSAALFVVGILTSTGVVLPASTSGMIRTVTGGAVTAASLIVALVSQLSHHSVQRAAINSSNQFVAQPERQSLTAKTRNIM